MKTLNLALGLALALLISTSSAWGNSPCALTGIGQTLTCDEVITISATGVVTITNNGTSYDGVEDQLVGVVNLWTGHTINNLGLTGTNIFGFDGDGANSAACVASGGNPYGCHPTANAHDGTAGGGLGYAGFVVRGGANVADDYFSNIVGFGAGRVNFVGGLAVGNTAWFSLEEPPTTGGLNVTVDVPEPGSIMLFGTVLAFVATRLRKRRAA